MLLGSYGAAVDKMRRCQGPLELLQEGKMMLEACGAAAGGI